MSDAEARLQRELEEIKAERDRKLGEGQRTGDRERELLKAKLQETEVKAKDAEARRAGLLFEQEKERARWALEKDHILSQR